MGMTSDTDGSMRSILRKSLILCQIAPRVTLSRDHETQPDVVVSANDAGDIWHEEDDCRRLRHGGYFFTYIVVPELTGRLFTA
jgi:hypothetical protein